MRAALEERFEGPARRQSPITGFLVALFIYLAPSVASIAMAAPPDTAAEFLRKADELRSNNYPAFAALLQSAEKSKESLSSEDQEYLRYLEAWKSAYDGDTATALARLTAVIDDAKNPTVR